MTTNICRLTAGQAIVRFLARQYVERDGAERRFIEGIWGIFGHGNVAGLGQGIVEEAGANGLKFYRPQNEQGMVHAAVAFAKHRNRLSTFACTTSIGPGALNMVTGAALATVNRLPVLLLPSDYFASRIPDPVLQQVEHPVERDVSASDAFRPVSRFFDRISRPEQLLASLPEAIRILADPAETGAVTITLPEDVQAEAYDWPPEFFEKRVWPVRRPLPEPEALGKLVALLQRAQRPLIITGGGTIYSEATEDLRQLAEDFGLPVTETQAGKGALAWNHPQNAGPIGSNGTTAANQLGYSADLVIAVGTRLTDFTTSSKSGFREPKVQFAGINVNAMDAHKLGAVAVVADAKRALKGLRQALHDAGYRGVSDAYRVELRDAKAAWDERVTELRTPGEGTGPMVETAVIGLVNEAFGGKATVVCAAGGMPGELLRLWRPEDSKAYHLEYGFSCMGYEIPGGLGVKLAEPERDVVVMVGDGSYLMMNSEIVTAVADQIPFTIVVVDNHGYQCILGLQRVVGVSDYANELRFRDQKSGQLTGGYVPVDFVKHAESMGARAVFASTYDGLKRALQEAKEADRVTVVVAAVDPEKRMPGFGTWWDVPVAQVSRDEKTRQTRRKYEEAVAQQRPVFGSHSLETTRS
ncbi:MAG: 3D-(3,5/4)-trihydroxycyclohexane-1,2-dione acylhydrolase (decyclizing) [Verrucomicrobia bacterium]|nr:3D-(3,5/4)-trihydroxycyclohexane-1,2-dione acylhydrolase (decyclizing) [Verrucomicrobiota bacterium]